jgi:hypothetical protein
MAAMFYSKDGSRPKTGNTGALDLSEAKAWSTRMVNSMGQQPDIAPDSTPKKGEPVERRQQR